MRYIRFRPIFAWLVATLLMIFGSRLINGNLLLSEWQRATIFRPWPEEFARYHFLRLGHCALALGAVWVYQRFARLRPGDWRLRGVEFGLALALISYVPKELIDYTTLPVPGSAAAKAAVLFTALLVLMGLSIAWFYRNDITGASADAARIDPSSSTREDA